jgi:predicted alpha/beta-hydrolase family hydrolase
MLTVYAAEKPRAAFILAHGAGAGQKSPFMVRFATGMADRGITTATFDFAYIEAKKSVPDRAPVLEQRWRDVVEEARSNKDFKNLPLAIGGKSMGGRIASHIAAQGVEGVSALVFLGYPLHPPGKPDQRRDAHLPSIKERMLFVQGSKDPFGTSAEIDALLPSLKRATLRIVPGGDHSFKVPGKQAQKDAAIEEIMNDVATFLQA